MLAGRTRFTSAPRHSRAFTLSSATSFGMMIATMVITQVTKCCYCQLTRVIASEQHSSSSLRVHWRKYAYLALAMVASEIPVEPTVPSNMREPVWGCRSPCRSASSTTAERVSEQRHGYTGCSVDLLRRATRSLTEPPGLRN